MRIIALTSAEVVNIRAPHQPEFVGIKTREDIALKDNEIGFIIGKRSLMYKGVFCQSGLIHPSWSGKLEPFFIVYGNAVISVGAQIAHAVILETEDIQK